MAYVTPIGSNPAQVDYRLGQGHGCTGPGDRQFSYHADGRERPLRWIGSALADLGIMAGSELTEEDFDRARTLMRGEHPLTGEVLVEPKLGVPDDAKVAVAPLVRAVDAVAAEAAVSVEEVLGHRVKLMATLVAARRAVRSKGESARLRADEAGILADAAGVDVEQVWGEAVYERAAENLWETRLEHDAGGVAQEVRVPRRTVVGNMGYDVTFTLPKSYSLLLAFAGEDVAAEVERIYTRQVEATFGWLESTTAYGMRGKHGGGRSAEVVKGNGFAGWVMVHRAARPVGDAEVGDPHWHVHATVANMTRGEDGKWSTVASGGRDLMRHAEAVDHVLKAIVRHELGVRFGIVFERNPRSEAWELAGIPDEALRLFSKRHADIKDMLTRLGFDEQTATRTQDRLAEQISRGKKGESVAAPDETLQQLWRAEERTAGRDPDHHIRLVMNGGVDPERPTGGPENGAAGVNRTDIGPDVGPSGGSGRTGARHEAPTDRGEAALGAGGKAVAIRTRPPSDVAIPAITDGAGGGGRALRMWTSPTTSASPALSAVDIAELLLDPETGLTAHSRRFSRARAIARVADAMPGGFATPDDIEEMTTAVLAHAGFVALPSTVGAEHMRNSAAYTTDDVVQAETVVLRAAKRVAKAAATDLSPVVVSDTAVMAMAIDTVETQQRYSLSDEQRIALERLVTQGRAIDAVNGAPGTGKTTLMRALRVVFEAAGFTVRGAATAAVAAHNLQSESGIPSTTVASYIHRIRGATASDTASADGRSLGELADEDIAAGATTRGGENGDNEDADTTDDDPATENSGLTDNGTTNGTQEEAAAGGMGAAAGAAVFAGIDVLVIDEANLTEDRARAMLYRAAAAAGTRIVEVGDSKQLRGVGVGSLFGRIHEIVDGAQLSDNRRQRDEDERDAIAAWREARYAEALNIWGTKAHLVATETAQEAIAAMLSRWWELRQGAGSAHREMRGLVMLAATNEQVRRLNAAAQALRLAEGQLAQSWNYSIAGGDRLRVYVGDHVLLKLNDRQQRRVTGDSVLNGYRALVTGIDEHGTVSVEWEHDLDGIVVTRRAALSPDYIAAGGLGLGYAITVHKSEGLTVAEQWTTPDDETSAGTVLFAAAGADNPATHVATSRHRGDVYLFAGRHELETLQDTHLRGVPVDRAQLLDRVIEQLAQRARDTETHGDDRPVVADLGLPEFTSEDGREQFDAATRDAEQEALHEARGRLRAEARAAATERARARHERRAAEERRAAADLQRRSAAAQLLREVWRHEPSLADAVVAAAAFGALARRFADADQAGYDLHEVMVEIPAHQLMSNRVRDPAALMTQMVDVAVKRLRHGAAADRAAQRDRVAQHAQLREQAADLLHEVWGSRPDLVDAVLAAPASDTFVTTLGCYADTELDLREVLGAIPVSVFAADRIRDRAAYATYVVRQVAESRLTALDDARARAQDRAELEARREETAETLRAAWDAHPVLAERIIASPAFPTIAERIQTAQDAGHDVNSVLARLDPQGLHAPRVRNPAGAFLWAFNQGLDHDPVEPTAASTNVPATQPTPVAPDLAAPDDTAPAVREAEYAADPAATPEQGAAEPAGLAPGLTDPDRAVDSVGPTDHSLDASQTGVDVADANPSPVEPPAAHVHETSTASPVEHPAHRDPDRDQESDADRDAGGESWTHWTQRPYGALGLRELHELLERAHHDGARLGEERATADRAAEEQRAATVAGHGSEVLVVDAHLRQAREQAAAVHEAQALETQWREATARAADAAAQRARADHELAGLGRLARARRAQLTEQTENLRAVETEAHRAAAELAAQAVAVQQRSGPRAGYQHVRDRARAVEQDHPHARAAAQLRDRDRAEVTYRHAARLVEHQELHAERLAELRAEAALRDRMPEVMTVRDDTERAAASGRPPTAQPAPETRERDPLEAALHHIEHDVFDPEPDPLEPALNDAGGAQDVLAPETAPGEFPELSTELPPPDVGDPEL